MSARRPRSVRTFCRMCGAACGAVVTVEGSEVVEVRGDHDHPVSRGYMCPKGRAMGRQHHHPDRLNQPMLRRDGSTTDVPWERALTDLSAGVQRVVDEAGPSAVAIYKGTAHGMESTCSGLAQWFLEGLGSRSWYTSLTVDGAGLALASELVLGHPWVLPVPDVDADLVILVGTNPIASHGHTLTMPRPKEQLREWAQRDGLWVIDPRRTASAEVATAHLAPRPGTDHVLLAHLVRELLRDGADRDYLDRHAAGVERLTAAVEPFGRDRAAAVAGIAPSEIDALLARIRKAGRVATVTGTGLSFAAGANVSIWLAWMLSAVTGSFDRPGGLWFNPGYLTQWDQQTWEPQDGSPAPGPASRPELQGRFGELPCVAMVDEIEARNVRALIVLGGNPLVAWPEPDRVAPALASLDVLAVLDVVQTEVGALATHLLPATGQLERADVVAADTFGLRTFSQLTGAVLAPEAQRRPAWWILAQLGRRLGLELPWDLDPDVASDEDVLEAVHGANAERWAALREDPSAVVVPERRFGWLHPKLPGGRLQLAPPMLVEQLAQLEDPVPTSLTLIPGRLLRKNNSTLADGFAVFKPRPPAATLNPQNALELGVTDGTPILISSAHGAVTVPARVDENARPGTVCLPHGFIAANATRLISSSAVDALTGMPVMTAVPVSVTPA